MWTFRSEALADGCTLKVAVELDASPVSFAEILNRWKHDREFRSFFIALLAKAPFQAFRWETPPISKTTVNKPFEFVLIDSPGLAANPDPHAFAEHFDGPSRGDVVVFPNLGKDAVMVVPLPKGPISAYGHLAAFVRQAPEVQRHALWEVVGDVMTRRLGDAPVWLSTAGAGVSWLHVRLDDYPKYYCHPPYRNATAQSAGANLD